jgi:hypothetical protein
VKALLARSSPDETMDGQETDVPIVSEESDDRDLVELARRCGELLAEPAKEEFPPAHWLG